MIEVVKNDELLFAQGTVCDGERSVIHFRQNHHTGESTYVIDLASHCRCGFKYMDHQVVAIAVGCVDGSESFE